MKLRRLLGVVAVSAVAMSLFSVSPASAGVATGATVWVAHGIPGAKVDVCVNGTEVKSNFKYGQKFKLANVPAGDYTIKVWAASDKECKGTLVIRKNVTLTDGLNATAVAKLTDGTPKLAIFVNNLTIGSDASVTVRHVANAPAVDVWVNGGTAPLVSGLAEGEEAGPVSVTEGVYAAWVSLPGDYAPVIGPAVLMLETGKAYQVLAVGTGASNYRFIVIGQAGVLV